MSTNVLNKLNVNLPKGTYVVAISGGVDSMVLLDILARQDDLKLVVAHFDHGIRQDSYKDRLLVERISKKYGLPFVTKKVSLGSRASEVKARDARYHFLRRIMDEQEADSIVTAHHKNDQLETAVFNLLRGTGRRGLTSLNSTDLIKRPLIKVSKSELYEYAKTNCIVWREDQTNEDLRYKRNYIRHKLLPKFDDQAEQKFVSTLDQVSVTNQSLDAELDRFISSNSNSKGQLNRHAFAMLPHKVAIEVLAAWLRQNDIREYDAKLLDRLTINAKVMKPGQQSDINAEYVLDVKKADLALRVREC